VKKPASTPLIAVAIFATFLFSSCQKSGSKQEAAAADSVTTGAIITPAEINTLTGAEKDAGWELLFDGTTLDGWKRYNAKDIGPLWTVKDGAIVCDGKGLTEGTADIGGSLMTKRQFDNFELSLEWKISPGGNSGILYHVVEDAKYKHDYETGPEFQVMDDDGWKGEKLRDAQKVGGNYDMYAAPDSKVVKPVGEWNSARLVYNNGHVEQWLNDVKVVDFEEGTPDYTERYKKSKWTGYPAWNKSKVGYLSLQDHGASVYYRSIKVKILK
jgi:Domain of Unknown Function (DUF1080)